MNKKEIQNRIHKLQLWAKQETHAPSRMEIQKVIVRLKKRLLALTEKEKKK